MFNAILTSSLPQTRSISTVAVSPVVVLLRGDENEGQKGKGQRTGKRSQTRKENRKAEMKRTFTIGKDIPYTVL